MDKNYILYEKVIDSGTYPMSEDMKTTLIVCLLLIVLCVLAVGLLKSADILLVAIPPFIIIIGIVGIWGIGNIMDIMGLAGGHETYKETNLSSVQADIQVEGDKVVIDKLPDKYYYEDNEDSGKYHVSRRVFKFDGFYDTKKLIDENGVELKLNEDDVKFLKERGAK